MAMESARDLSSSVFQMELNHRMLTLTLARKTIRLEVQHQQKENPWKTQSAHLQLQRTQRVIIQGMDTSHRVSKVLHIYRSLITGEGAEALITTRMEVNWFPQCKLRLKGIPSMCLTTSITTFLLLELKGELMPFHNKTQSILEVSSSPSSIQISQIRLEVRNRCQELGPLIFPLVQSIR